MRGFRVRALFGAGVLLFAVSAKAIPAGAAGQSVGQKLKACADGQPLGSFIAYLHTLGLRGFGHMNIEVGTPGNDTFTDTPGVDLMCGLAGNDGAVSLHDGDVFLGGDGDDFVGNGGELGSPHMFGGTFVAGNGDDGVAELGGGTFDGGDGNNHVNVVEGGVFNGGGGNDDVTALGFGTLRGVFNGGDGNDEVTEVFGGVFNGGPGNDRVTEMDAGIFNGGPGFDRVGFFLGGTFNQ